MLIPNVTIFDGNKAPSSYIIRDEFYDAIIRDRDREIPIHFSRSIINSINLIHIIPGYAYNASVNNKIVTVDVNI